MTSVTLLVGGCAETQPEKKVEQVSGLISEAVDISTLQVRGNLAYVPNRDNPFTGWIKKQYDGNQQIEGLIEFKKGEPSEILVLHPNGSPKFVAHLKTGSEAAD